MGHVANMNESCPFYGRRKRREHLLQRHTRHELTYATWLIHTWAMTYSYGTCEHLLQRHTRHELSYATWLIHIWDITYLYGTCKYLLQRHTRHELSFATWLIHYLGQRVFIWDMQIPPPAPHSSLALFGIRSSVILHALHASEYGTWLITRLTRLRIWDMTHDMWGMPHTLRCVTLVVMGWGGYG